MPEAEVAKANTGVEPTAVQEARVASLNRFNWYFVYAPILVLLLAVFILTGLLMWGALSPNISGTRAFISGVANIIVILAAIPMSLMCLVPSLAAVGLMLYRRQKQKEGVKYGRLHRLFWRIETILDIVQAKTEANLPKVGQPIIRLHAILAFITTLLHHIASLFRR
jgi:hypothetical protein